MTQPAHEVTPEPDLAQGHLDALRSSVERLRVLAAPKTAADLRSPAYPADRTVAQVLSHLGSGAVIMQRRLQDTLAGQNTPENFAPDVWDTWNARAR